MLNPVGDCCSCVKLACYAPCNAPDERCLQLRPTLDSKVLTLNSFEEINGHCHWHYYANTVCKILIPKVNMMSFALGK